jgi:hypothetical protein
MKAKNLEGFYSISIEDIDAGRVKELLISKGFDDPILTSNMVAKAIICLGGAAMDAEEGSVNRAELQFSMNILEGVFDFFTDLMNEPAPGVSNH